MDDYQHLRLLSRDSNGIILSLVRQVPTGRLFALKRIQLSGSDDDEVLREAQALCQLTRSHHPHLIRCHLFFQDAPTNSLCVLMAHCDDESLDEKIKATQAHFSQSQVMNWFVQVMLAVDYLHRNRIVHKDIKPANLFLNRHDIIKLGNFGLYATSIQPTTFQGQKANYNSPELCCYGHNRPYFTVKSDIWAVGCVFYEVCCLKPAFNASSSNLLNFLHKIVVNVDFENAIPKQIYCFGIVKLIKTLLSINPNRRPSTNQILCDQFVQKHLDAYIADHENISCLKHERFDLTCRNTPIIFRQEKHMRLAATPSNASSVHCEESTTNTANRRFGASPRLSQRAATLKSEQKSPRTPRRCMTPHFSSGNFLTVTMSAPPPLRQQSSCDISSASGHSDESSMETGVIIVAAGDATFPDASARSVQSDDDIASDVDDDWIEEVDSDSTDSELIRLADKDEISLCSSLHNIWLLDEHSLAYAKKARHFASTVLRFRNYKSSCGYYDDRLVQSDYGSDWSEQDCDYRSEKTWSI